MLGFAPCQAGNRRPTCPMRAEVLFVAENKRSLCFIETQEYGEVAFVCIGATMVCADQAMTCLRNTRTAELRMRHPSPGWLQVGSIVLTAQEGQRYEKGDEMGYFAFGGSTTIALFQEGSIEFDSDLLEHRCELFPWHQNKIPWW